MKKRDLAAFAMIIMSAALLIGACQQQPTSGGPAPAAGQMSPSQQSFSSALSPDAQRKFNELDARRKQAAVDQANQGMDPNQAVNAQYDQMKQDKGRPPASPGNPPMPPKKPSSP